MSKPRESYPKEELKNASDLKAEYQESFDHCTTRLVYLRVPSEYEAVYAYSVKSEQEANEFIAEIKAERVADLNTLLGWGA